jgi:hypothetical protein
MVSALRGLTFFACCAVLFGQAPSAPQSAGLETAWEIAPVLQEISAHYARLLPLLDKVDAKGWVGRGASDTYVAQLQSTKEQARAIVDGAKALAQNPEKLSASIEVLFRIQGLETMVHSLEDGIRKYQNPAAAQELAQVEAENGANRDRLQHYIVNLAAEREQELQVMDREAQRCRGILTQTPPKSGRKK